MEGKQITEKKLNPRNGFAMLAAIIIGFLASIALLIFSIFLGLSEVDTVFGVILLIISALFIIALGILSAGFKIVRPGEARILMLFGTYYGTIKESGFYHVNPFCESFSPAYNAAKAEAEQHTLETGKLTTISTSKTISLKMQTLNNSKQKVNDVLGNPIIIGAVVIWQVVDATKAAFAVENYEEFLSIQTDSTIRNIARLYPYDIFDEDEDDDNVQEKSLRGSAIEIADMMSAELQKRVADAGLRIEEVRITHLAYSEEIAAAMLQRQQASAIIAARQKIVDGAVGMVKMAIDKLGEDEIVVLDEERKAAMVSNLLVVLCGNKDAQPIVNSGTIY